MKKILAMMLTAAMMLSMGTAVFAADGDQPTTPAQPEAGSGTAASELQVSDEVPLTIYKNYYLNDSTTEKASVFPNETIYFEQTKVTVTDSVYNETTVPSLIIAEEGYPITKNGQELTITVPSYSEVGKFTYEITEIVAEEDKYDAVGYDTKPKVLVSVLAYYDYGAEKILTTITTATSENGLGEGKDDQIDNRVNTGTLVVEKQVEGKLGDYNDVFEFTVVFTAPTDEDWSLASLTQVAQTVTENTKATAGDITADDAADTITITFTASHAGEVTITGIPYGFTYDVTETDPTPYVREYDDNKAGTIGKDAIETIVTNTWDTTVDTGISVDSIPYIAMLGVVAIGGTGFIVSKKRRSED